MEEWRVIDGFNNYMVSSLGRVKSIVAYHNRGGKILSQNKRPDGYMEVGLSLNGKSYHKTVHRLVAIAFIENPDGLEMVNHKDENKSNNNVENLEWCSRRYNQIYSLNLHPERKKIFADNFKKDGKSTSSFIVRGVAHKNHEPVIQKTLDGEFVARYDNSAQAAKALNCDVGHIYNAAKRNARTDRVRKRKTKCKSHGYIWEFE